MLGFYDINSLLKSKKYESPSPVKEDPFNLNLKVNQSILHADNKIDSDMTIAKLLTPHIFNEASG